MSFVCVVSVYLRYTSDVEKYKYSKGSSQEWREEGWRRKSQCHLSELYFTTIGIIVLAIFDLYRRARGSTVRALIRIIARQMARLETIPTLSIVPEHSIQWRK